MGFDKEKWAQMTQPRNEEARRRAEFRQNNREWLRMSQQIALAMHYYLRTTGTKYKSVSFRVANFTLLRPS